MKPPKKVVAIIVTYNRLEKLKTCWAAIASQNIYGAVIINNNSSDGTGKWIGSIDDDRLRPIHLEKNIGGAGGFRKGCEYGLKVFQDADWFLLFDDDAYAKPNIINEFFKINTDYDLISAKVLNPSDRPPKMNLPLVNVPESIQDMLIYLIRQEKFRIDPNNCDRPTKVKVSSFVGLFVSRRCLEQMLWAVRPEFFLYCDDAYFTYQAYLAGYTNCFMQNLIFIHDITVSKLNKTKLYYLIRNDVVVKKAYSPNYFFIAVLMRFIYYAVKMFKFEKSWTHLPVMFRALMDGLKNDLLVPSRE